MEASALKERIGPSEIGPFGSPNDSTSARIIPPASGFGLPKTLFWLVAILLGGLQAWQGRYPIDADGVSYLDIADAYMRGDWRNAINAYWSPLYSWILGLVLHLARPSSFWESSVVRLVNFAIFLGAL